MTGAKPNGEKKRENLENRRQHLFKAICFGGFAVGVFMRVAVKFGFRQFVILAENIGGCFGGYRVFQLGAHALQFKIFMGAVG